MTDVDGAETHREQAHAVNAEGAGNLARAAAAARVPLVHVSTDYVFAGDGTRPIVAGSIRSRQPRRSRSGRPELASGIKAHSDARVRGLIVRDVGPDAKLLGLRRVIVPTPALL